MGRPPRAVKRKSIVLRLEPDQIALIDAACGTGDRHTWMVAALMVAAEPVQPLWEHQPTPEPAAAEKPAVEAARPIKSRLKGVWKAP